MDVNDRVTYNDANLRDYHGVLVSLGRTIAGGDCRVHWMRPVNVVSDECLYNLLLHA